MRLQIAGYQKLIYICNRLQVQNKPKYYESFLHNAPTIQEYERLTYSEERLLRSLKNLRIS